jgi:hypothetical protein
MVHNEVHGVSLISALGGIIPRSLGGLKAVAKTTALTGIQSR